MESAINNLSAELAAYYELPVGKRNYNTLSANARVELEREFEREDEKRRADEKLRWFKQATQDLPDSLFNHFDLTQHPNPNAHEKVMAWQSGKKGLMLVGQTGTGKSRSLLQLIRRLTMEMDQNITYWSAPRLSGRISALAFESSHDLNRLITALEASPILAIDDLGAHKPTERVASEFHRIIDTRYARGLPLLVTTNCLPPEMQQKLLDEHGRTIRRLQDMTQVINF